MKCPICQEDNPEENRFCPNCGTRLRADSAPRSGALGTPKGGESLVIPLDEEKAKERRRLDAGKSRILVRGIVVGSIVAGAIGAFVGVLTGLAMVPMSEQAASMGVKAAAVLSGLTGALQGAVAGAAVSGIVVTVGGGPDTGWRAGALVNAGAYVGLSILAATGWGRWIILFGAGAALRAYAIGLIIWALWGALYGWVIGLFVESSLERW